MHEFLAIQHGNPDISLRQIERNRSSDDAPADDHDIVRFHANILSAMRIEGGFCRLQLLILSQIALWLLFCSEKKGNVRVPGSQFVTLSAQLLGAFRAGICVD